MHMYQSIYVIGTDNHEYKIGVSANPEKRLLDLEVGNSKKLSLFYKSMLILNAVSLEKLIHEKLKKFKIKGEWFHIENIEELKKIINTTVNENGIVNEIVSQKKEIFKTEMEQIKANINDLKRQTAKENKENKKVTNFLRYLQGGYDQCSCEYANIIYRTLFGKPLKELQKEFGVKSRETIRDYLNAEQLKEVEAMEMLISSLINIGWGYEQIKNFIREHYAKKLAS